VTLRSLQTCRAELEQLKAELTASRERVAELDAVIRRQANSAKMGMDAATAISNQQLLQAAKLRAESSPDALESERAMNAILTAELEHLKAERDALKATLDDYMDDYKAVVNEQCAKNEKHCTCVPHLRQRIKEVEAERDALKTELHIAVGLLSTQPDYSAKHPMDVLQIVKDAALDAARSET
jgi:uncharacterized protein YhaN